MTTSAQESLFAKQCRSRALKELAKDFAVVTLAGVIVAGFLWTVMQHRGEPAAVRPAVFLAAR